MLRILLLLGVAVLLPSCLIGQGPAGSDAQGSSDSNTDTVGVADTDADSDTDADGDTDGDSDSDTDADADSESDTVVSWSCTNQWQGTDCDICPENWDSTKDCNVCENHWEGASCTECLDNWDSDQDCAQCRNHWIDESNDCGTCPGNWDSNSDCAQCRNHWIDEGNDCGTCPVNWDIDSNCSACKGNWDPALNCLDCEYGWEDNGDDCGTCPANWDLSGGCKACLGNWDLSTGCTVCENGWVDNSNDCGTCPTYYTGANCDTCASSWTGETCRVWKSALPSGSDIDLVIGTDQKPLYFSIWRGSTDYVYVRHCADLDCSSFTAKQPVSSTANLYDLDAELAPDGNARFVYYNSTTTETWFARCSDAECSSVTQQNVIDGYSAVLVEAAVPLANPILAGISSPSYELKISYCQDPQCTAVSTSTVSLGEDTTSMLPPVVDSAIIDSQGFVLLTYYSPELRRHRLVRCNDATCFGSSIRELSDSYNASLAIGTDGFPIVVETMVNSGNPADMTLLKCTDYSCSTPGSSVIHSGQLANARATIGADGYPLIAFEEEVGTSWHFRVMHCADALCGSKQITTLATVGTGLDTILLVIGPDSYPALVKESLNNYFHCYTQSCR